MIKKRKNNLFQELFSLRIIRWIVIPALLLLVWLFLALLYSSYQSLTVLQYAHNLDKSDNFNLDTLYKGRKITGVFTAKENHLGIVSVRFGNVPKPDYKLEDIILFKIKRVGQKNWMYENKYRSGAIISGQYYPFGFKQIDDSQGKKYEFQVSSLRGDYINAVEISREDPIYLEKYKFSRHEIIQNLNSVISFFTKKIITFSTNSEALISSTVFILPFVFYMLWIMFPIDKLIKSDGKVTGNKLFQAFVAILIISDVSFYEFLNTGFMIGLIGLWIISIYVNRSKSFVSYILAFFLIVLSILTIYFHLNISVDKASAFAYFILVIGFFQSAMEYKLKYKGR